jgi:peptidoglycan LD-endopeptidase CwlK
MDTVSEQRLSEVYPGLAVKVRAMADQLAAEGIDIRVTQSLRTLAEQEALYAAGRTAGGNVVTDAQPGYSWHNFGLAVDVAPLTPQGPDWNINHPVWQRIVAVGESLGMVAGATWRSFPDWPHFQLTGTFPISPNDAARSLLATGGVSAVWAAAFPSQATNLDAQDA